MRTFLVLIGIVLLAGVAALQFGIVNIDQTQAAVVQAPKFEANVAKVELGTEQKTVAVPTLSVEKPGNTQ